MQGKGLGVAVDMNERVGRQTETQCNQAEAVTQM